MKIKDYLWSHGIKFLRKMKVVNSVFLSKLTWKLFYDQSFWAEQMQTKYQVDEIYKT